MIKQIIKRSTLTRMSLEVRLRARKDYHPCNAYPKTIPFSLVLPFYDDSSMLFYFHMIRNGHKILMSTNIAKLPPNTSEMVKGQLLWPMIEKYLFIRRKINFDYFEKTIGNLSGGFIWKCLEYFRGYLKHFTSRFSWDATANTKIRRRYFDFY